MRIFVDVDDCLVLWDKRDKNKWYPNFKVIGYVFWASNFFDDEIIIWSGGGIDYARTWRDRLELNFATVMAKDIGFPDFEDIVIDDQPIKTDGLLINPDSIGITFPE